MLWFWFLAAPAILLALLSLRKEGVRAQYAAAQLRAEPRAFPPVSVIVPVKGADPGLRENLAALASLDYPNYELIIVARTAEDIPPSVLPSAVKIVLAQGSEPETGEKIQNLLAAVRATRKPSEVFAFADSDGLPGKRWLRALVAALECPGVGAATGYRWFAPGAPTFWGMLRSSWNAAIAGSFGPGDNRFAWGGATAIRKDAFFELHVPDYWRGAIVSDDYALSAAVHAAGLRIAWAPGATILSTSAIGPAELFEWTRRQLVITRFYAPALWLIAFVAHFIYCAGMTAVIVAAANGYPWLLWLLVPMLVPGMVKAYRRAVIARSNVPGAHISPMAHALYVPAATWLWMISLVASGVGRSIRWRGYQYRLRHPNW